MNRSKIILIIGLTEIVLGVTTFTANFITILFYPGLKPLNVILFVLTTSVISTFLGIGLLLSKRLAYQMLVYFSSVIVLSKFLIFADIIDLNHALATVIPSAVKNGISVIYHGFIVAYFGWENVRKFFCERIAWLR